MIFIVAFIYYSEYQGYKLVVVKEAQMGLKTQSDFISRELKKISMDLLFLSSNTLVSENDSYGFKRTESLIQFMQIKTQYDQLRFIDTNGMEQLRINQGNPPLVVPEDKLQSKITRDYVQDGMRLSKNEILISRLDLNQENGKIELPHKPTLRFIIPAFDTNGERKGLFVLNFLAAELLNDLQNVQSNHLIHIEDNSDTVSFLMANAAGNWIIAPKNGTNFGFMFQGTGNELAAFSKEAWEALQSDDLGVVSANNTELIFQNIYPIELIQMHPDAGLSQALAYKIKSSDVVWRTIIELPNATVHALTKTYFYKSLPYILLFWIILQMLSAFLLYIYRRNKEQHAELLLTASALENSADGVIVTDSEGTILRLNESYSRITGYDAAELIGKKTNTMSSGWTETEVYKNMWDSLATKGYWEGELKDRAKSGAVYVVWLRIVKVVEPQTQKINYVGITTDITEKKEFEERITDLAYRDSLTKLPNRHLFHDRLRKSMSKRRANGEKLAVMFIDLDNFKLVNDTAGHLVGDKFLIEIANRFREVLRDYDTLARVGGDEFIILLEKVDDYVISDVAFRLIESLSNPIAIAEHEFFTSASIGVSVYPHDGADDETLIKNADTAMYEAKNNGKNSYRFFKSSMNEEMIRRVLLETNLMKAVENEEFTLHYQPQICAIDNTLVGAEALLRWNNKNLGFVSPAEFIPIAESTRKIVPITEWILAQVCKDILLLESLYSRSFNIAINISSVHLKSEFFVENIDSIIKKYGVEPSQIELEITEGALVSDIEESTKKLNALKALGYKISIDDFGTGYSSLSYLKKFPFDKLKIDKSFIDSLPQDVQDVGIVRSIIGITHALDLKVIAEGAETQAHVDFLLKEGCSLIQGYYFSKPLPIEKYSEFIKNREPAAL
jgi:diguanylate cyclase (GGDEF)-like protein/PAS domain S-box-containing protein